MSLGGIPNCRWSPTKIQEAAGLGWAVGWPKHSIYSAYTFEHDISYIDIYTNNGSFRFNSDGMLIGPVIGGPRADIKQLTQLEDAKIEALEKQIISARKHMFANGDTNDPLLKKYSAGIERSTVMRPGTIEAAAREFQKRLFRGKAPDRRLPPGGPVGRAMPPPAGNQVGNERAP